MRTYSTPESALKGEITKLGIFECFLSVAIYVGIGMYAGSFKHLVVAIAVAPLMLFRTEFSAEWGLAVYGRVLDILIKLPEPLNVFSCVTVGAIAGPLIRFVATVYWTLRRPLQTFKETPQNWLRQALCTDILHPPEIIPLEAARGDSQKIPTFAEFISYQKSEHSVFEKIMFIVVISPFFVIGWIPSLFYRISFKATAVAYMPFIWVTHATLRNSLSTKMRLQRITQGELEKVRRGFSWIIVATLTLKAGFAAGWIGLDFIEEKFQSRQLVESLVVLDGWPWWQITLAMDALLTFFLFFFADAALVRIENQQIWREKAVAEAVSAITFLRATFSVVTILRFFYLAVIAVIGVMLGLPDI